MPIYRVVTVDHIIAPGKRGYPYNIFSFFSPKKTKKQNKHMFWALIRSASSQRGASYEYKNIDFCEKINFFFLVEKVPYLELCIVNVRTGTIHLIKG